MDISLDNPGFNMATTDAEVHFSDPPKSLGSSTSSDSTRRSCKKCHGRMSSLSLDRHLFCIKCRGLDCTLMSRCDECIQWTKEEMESYIKLRRSLTSKGRRSKSSPRSTRHDRDFGQILTAQLDSVNKSIDKKIEAMSSSLMSRFSSMLESFQLSLNQTSITDDSAVPGYSACLSEPPFLRPTVSTKSRKGLRFREGAEDPVPHESGLASASGFMDETPETVRHPPGDSGEPQGSQRAPEFTRQRQSGAGFESQHEDEDEDDRQSVTEISPPDKAYNNIMYYIYDRFPHSAPHLPPRCEFEEFFATSAVTSSTKPNLLIYPRVSEIVEASADRASRLARESRPLHRVVPLRRRTFHVGDQPDYCTARFLNLDFSRISKQKTIFKSRSSSISLSDLEKLDRASRSILAGESQSFWLLSSPGSTS